MSGNVVIGIDMNFGSGFLGLGGGSCSRWASTSFVHGRDSLRNV